MSAASNLLPMLRWPAVAASVCCSLILLGDGNMAFSYGILLHIASGPLALLVGKLAHPATWNFWQPFWGGTS